MLKLTNAGYIITIITTSNIIIIGIKSWKKALKNSYSEMIAKITLLIGAGMTMRKAWEKIVEESPICFFFICNRYPIYFFWQINIFFFPIISFGKFKIFTYFLQNSAINNITSDVVLCSSIDKYPVTIQWLSDNYDQSYLLNYLLYFY